MIEDFRMFANWKALQEGISPKLWICNARREIRRYWAMS